MADPEQNEKMDALLRAYAERPRAAVGLSSEGRGALHREVKAVFGATQAKPRKAKFWPAWWIRWPVAAGFAAWAMLLVMNSRRFEEGQALSRQESSWLASEKAPGLKKNAELAAAAPPPVANGPTAMAAAPVETPALAPTGRTFGRMQTSVLPAAPTGASEQSFRAAGGVRPLLNNFQVRREGETISVTDEDGSVYVGRLVPSSLASGSADTARYSFAVRGTNQTLQQIVLFNGEMLNSSTDKAPEAGKAEDRLRTRAPKPSGPEAGQQIRGTVTAGKTIQFPVEARAVTPP